MWTPTRTSSEGEARVVIHNNSRGRADEVEELNCTETHRRNGSSGETRATHTTHTHTHGGPNQWSDWKEIEERRSERSYANDRTHRYATLLGANAATKGRP